MQKASSHVVDRSLDLQRSTASVSEARAEAAFFVPGAMLKLLPSDVAKAAARVAYAATDQIGHEGVTEEVEDLLGRLDRATVGYPITGKPTATGSQRIEGGS